MKLKTRLLIAFLAISNIPLLIITLFTYDRYTSLVDTQTTQMYTNVFQSAADEANKTIRDVSHIAEIFSFYSETNTSIVEDIKKYSSPDKPFTSHDIAVSNNNIKFICQNLIYSNSYINGIFLLTPAGVSLGYGYGGSIDIRYGYDPTGKDWYQKTLDAGGRIVVSDLSEKDYIIFAKPSVTFTRALYDVLTHEYLGVLVVDCSPQVFDLSHINTLPQTALLSVQNGSGDILYSNIDDIADPFPLTGTRVIREELDIEGLSLVSAVNHEKLYREFGVTRIIIVVIASVCALLFLMISVLLSHSLTQPIAHLSQKMANHSMQSMVTRERLLRRTDEIGVLCNEYNSMISEFQQLVKNEYQNKLITLDAQMRALEAQINSHFLYNTLESINSIAEIEEVDSISTMSLALGNMFRYSIKTQSELVTLEEEMGHVRDYLAIQQIRFDGGFTVELQIPRELMGLRVLKLILQPIVENALYHGLRSCTAGDRIRLACETDEDEIRFTVSDNGAGMTAKSLGQLRDKLKEEAHFTELGHRQKQSIGLKNIHSRIELYYGKGWGLTVESTEGAGTSVRIRLPRLPGKEERPCTPIS